VSAREILAYAITHAPKGVKGGPYEAIGGDMGDTCARLSASLRWPVDNPVNTPEEVLAGAREFLAEEIAPKVPHARVIRIVRKARPSEPMSRMPDPMPVVRAAMRETEAEEAFDRVALKGRSMNAAADAIGVARANRVEAVDAYRKAGGTP